MASDIWLSTILIVRKETRCCHIGYSYRLTARVLLYAPSHRQDNTYHGLCYTSRGALAGTRNSSMGPPHEGSIRRPIAPWANALPLSYVPLLSICNYNCLCFEMGNLPFGPSLPSAALLAICDNSSLMSNPTASSSQHRNPATNQNTTLV